MAEKSLDDRIKEAELARQEAETAEVEKRSTLAVEKNKIKPKAVPNQNGQAPDWLFDNIAEASKNARRIYLLYIGALAYFALTVFTTPDRRIFFNEPTRLPIVNLEVSFNAPRRLSIIISGIPI